MASLGQAPTRPAPPLAVGIDRALFVLGVVLAVGGWLAGAAGAGRAALWPLLAWLPWGLLLGRSVAAREALADFVHRRWAALAGDAPRDGALRLQAAFLFVVLPAAWFFLSNNRTVGSGDTWPVMPTAASLIRQGNLEVGEYVAVAPRPYYLPAEGRLYCLIRSGDGWYSSYPGGMVPLALPAAGVHALTGRHLRLSTLSHLEKWSAAGAAALALGLFFLIATRLVGPLAALATTALLAVGSVFSTTLSQGLWQQTGVVLWSLLVLWLEFQPGVRGRTGATAVQGLALALMLACRLSAALFVVPFGLWVLVRSPGRAFALAGFALLAYAPWMLLYHSIYGTPFGPSVGQLQSGVWGADVPGGLAGILVSPARGLLVYQPWLLLVPVALWLGRGEGPPGWRLFVAAFVALHVLLVASWECWFGGDCWGSRLLAETVAPLALLALPAVAWLLRFRGGWAVLGLFFALALVLHVREMYFPTFWEGVYRDVPAQELMWSWERAPFVTAPYRH